MQVIEVQSKKYIRDFHQLPFKIYADDKNWIPHIKQDIEAVFNPENNKAFKHGDAQRWVLYNDDKQAIGRIAAFYDRRESNSNKQPTGGLGFFECVKDKKAAFLLFDTCKKWLEKNGLEAMDGPINFGEKDQFWGLLVKNFTFINAYRMNYNPPYYQALFEEYGFEKYYEQWVYKRDMLQAPQKVFYRRYNQIKNDPEMDITSGRGKSLEQLVHDFRTVYNDAWSSHKGFKPISKKAAFNLFKTMKSVIDKDILIFVYHKNKPIAFWLNLPEINQIFKYINGNLNLIGKIKFLYHRWVKKPTIMAGLVFGVAHEYQKKGYEAAMIVWSYEHISLKKHYRTITLNWIGDFNPKMIKVCKNLGAEKHRILHTYRYLFDRNIPFERRQINE